MTDDARTERNRAELQSCFPWFRTRLAKVLATLQAQGFRPRIQQAWRSPEDQLVAFATGHSKLKYGFHNTTASDGTPEALAADVLQDEFPLNPTREYLLALVRVARKHDLDTGIEWDLPLLIRSALNDAIRNGKPWEGKIGWDSCHVECATISVAQAKAGVRPQDPTAERALKA